MHAAIADRHLAETLPTLEIDQLATVTGGDAPFATNLVGRRVSFPYIERGGNTTITGEITTVVPDAQSRGLGLYVEGDATHRLYRTNDSAVTFLPDATRPEKPLR
jgi:hypothetical protein